MNSIDAIHEEILAELRHAYLRAVDNLVNEFPIQEQNRSHFEQWALNAHLGRLLIRIRSKGNFSAYNAFAPVLFLEDDVDEGMVSIWNRQDGQECRTLVSAKHVQPVL